MVDLQGKDKGNISLPPNLQSPDTADWTAQELDEQPMILNMQKAMYKSLIDDLEQKMQRLQTRNEKLEGFSDYVKNYSDNKNVESEGVIVELNANIAYQTKQVDELKQRCKNVEESRRQRVVEHEIIKKKIREKFEETRKQHSSEIKLLNAKINALEDFKAAEDALIFKLNSNNEYIARKEEELQQKLKDFEFKTKIHRENLRKETYKQVLETSKNFQSDLRTTIPLTVQRMLRENIILENELIQCWGDHSNITEHRNNYKNSFQGFRERIKEAKLHTRKRLITLKIQNMLLKKLRIGHSIVAKELSKSYDTPKNFEEKYQRLIDGIHQGKFNDEDYIRRKLEVVLHQERIKLALTDKFKSKTIFAMNSCCDALSLIKCAVNTAVSSEAEMVDLESFASYVLNVIEDCKTKKWVAPVQSIETVALPSNVYMKGDLGFEPEHIDVNTPLPVKGEDDLSTHSVMSTLEILEQLDKLKEKVPEKKRISEQTRDTVISDLSGSDKSDESTSSSELADEKRKEEKLRLFYEDIFGDDSMEYEMEGEYEYYTNSDQE